VPFLNSTECPLPVISQSVKPVTSANTKNRTKQNLRRTVLEFYANIYFNSQCLKQNLTPNYTKIKTPNTSPALKFTKHKTVKLSIKDEIKFFYVNINKSSVMHYLKYIYKPHKIGVGGGETWGGGET
jgi:hypothetical protein